MPTLRGPLKLDVNNLGPTKPLPRSTSPSTSSYAPPPSTGVGAGGSRGSNTSTHTEVLAATVHNLKNELEQRPVDIGLCLSAVSSVSHVITQSLQALVGIGRTARSSSSSSLRQRTSPLSSGGGPGIGSPDLGGSDEHNNNNIDSNLLINPKECGVLGRKVLCPTSLVEILPVLFEFLVYSSNYSDTYYRTVECAVCNVVLRIVIWLDTPMSSPVEKLFLQRLPFLLHAAKLQLTEITKGKVRLCGAPSFKSISMQEMLLSTFDDYLYICVCTLLKLSESRPEALTNWLEDLLHDNSTNGGNGLPGTTKGGHPDHHDAEYFGSHSPAFFSGDGRMMTGDEGNQSGLANNSSRVSYGAKVSSSVPRWSQHQELTDQVAFVPQGNDASFLQQQQQDGNVSSGVLFKDGSGLPKGLYVRDSAFVLPLVQISMELLHFYALKVSMDCENLSSFSAKLKGCDQYFPVPALRHTTSSSAPRCKGELLPMHVLDDLGAVLQTAKLVLQPMGDVRHVTRSAWIVGLKIMSLTAWVSMVRVMASSDFVAELTAELRPFEENFCAFSSEILRSASHASTGVFQLIRCALFLSLKEGFCMQQGIPTHLLSRGVARQLFEIGEACDLNAMETVLALGLVEVFRLHSCIKQLFQSCLEIHNSLRTCLELVLEVQTMALYHFEGATAGGANTNRGGESLGSTGGRGSSFQSSQQQQQREENERKYRYSAAKKASYGRSGTNSVDGGLAESKKVWSNIVRILTYFVECSSDENCDHADPTWRLVVYLLRRAEAEKQKEITEYQRNITRFSEQKRLRERGERDKHESISRGGGSFLDRSIDISVMGINSFIEEGLDSLDEPFTLPTTAPYRHSRDEIPMAADLLTEDALITAALDELYQSGQQRVNEDNSEGSKVPSCWDSYTHWCVISDREKFAGDGSASGGGRKKRGKEEKGQPCGYATPQLNPFFEGSLFFLDILLSRNMREGDLISAARYCESYASLLNTLPHFPPEVLISILQGASRLYEHADMHLESWKTGCDAASLSFMLLGDLSQSMREWDHLEKVAKKEVF